MTQPSQAARDAAEPIVTQADEEWAEEVASAANIVTNGGYYEIDIDAVALVIARHREAAEAASKAREAALVEALAIFDEPMSPLTGGERGDELACAVRTFLSRSGDSK